MTHTKTTSKSNVDSSTLLGLVGSTSSNNVNCKLLNMSRSGWERQAQRGEVEHLGSRIPGCFRFVIICSIILTNLDLVVSSKCHYFLIRLVATAG